LPAGGKSKPADPALAGFPITPCRRIVGTAFPFLLMFVLALCQAARREKTA
jgi:hypothetical protein